MSDETKLPAIGQLLQVARRCTGTSCHCFTLEKQTRKCLSCMARAAIEAYESENLPAAVDKAIEDLTL